MDSIDILNGNFSKENENVNIVEESEFSKLLYAYLEMESDISELYGIFKKIDNFVNGLDISNKFRKNIFNDLFSGLLFNDYVTPLIDQQQPIKDKLSEKYHLNHIDILKLNTSLLIRAYEYSKKSEYSLIIGERGTAFSNLYSFIVKNSGLNFSTVNTPDELLNISYNDCEGIFIVIREIEQYDVSNLKDTLAELNNGKNRFIFTSTCDLGLLENKGYLELPEIKNCVYCIYNLPTFSNFLKNMDNLYSLIKWEMRGCSRYGRDEHKILERFKVFTNNYNELLDYDWPGNFEQFESVIKEFVETDVINFHISDINYNERNPVQKTDSTTKYDKRNIRVPEIPEIDYHSLSAKEKKSIIDYINGIPGGTFDKVEALEKLPEILGWSERKLGWSSKVKAEIVNTGSSSYSKYLKKIRDGHSPKEA